MSIATTKAAATSRRGIFMILSPAKTLDLSISEIAVSPPIDDSYASCDLTKTRQLAEILKSKSKKQLKDLLKVSDKISCTVKDYYDAFDVDLLIGQQKNNDGPGSLPAGPNKVYHNNNNEKAAVLSFDGPAFKGISASTCDPDTVQYMQNYLRIIDPLYGALRPLDQIQPYRLEMATKGILKDLNTDDKSLAKWWKASITTSILQDMKASECKLLINLASDEYSSALDATKLHEQNCKIIKVAFQQDGKVVAVHAKKARGLMVRYISENNLDNAEGIQSFDLEGYGFCENRSDEMTIVFDRSKNWKDEIERLSSISATDKKRKATEQKQLGKKGVLKKMK